MSNPNRVIRDDVRAYCSRRALSETQTMACVEMATLMHSIDAGKETADRLARRNETLKNRNSLCLENSS